MLELVTLIGVEAGPGPPIDVFATVIWYVVPGCRNWMTPLVTVPVTFVVSTEFVGPTGVAASIDDVTASGFTPVGVQATSN